MRVGLHTPARWLLLKTGGGCGEELEERVEEEEQEEQEEEQEAEQDDHEVVGVVVGVAMIGTAIVCLHPLV